METHFEELAQLIARVLAKRWLQQSASKRPGGPRAERSQVEVNPPQNRAKHRPRAKD